MGLIGFFKKVNTVTATNARKIIEHDTNDSVTLVDVREPAEYKHSHIPGALLLPLSELMDKADTLDDSKKIIAYCARGRRSGSAAALLERKGFRDVVSLEGGIEAWNGNVAEGPYEAGLHLIEGIESTEDLTALALQFEEGARLFYSRTREMIQDEEAKDLLGTLVMAEEQHKKHVHEAFMRIKGKEFDSKAQKHAVPGNIMEGGISVEEALGRLKQGRNVLYDVLELSMQLEANSLDLYMKMLHDIENEDAEKIFQQLITEEKSHLKRLGQQLEKTAGR